MSQIAKFLLVVYEYSGFNSCEYANSHLAYWNESPEFVHDKEMYIQSGSY